MLASAVEEAALMVAHAKDRACARVAAGKVLDRMLFGLQSADHRTCDAGNR